MKDCAYIIAENASDWHSIEHLEKYGFAECVGEQYWKEAKAARAQREEAAAAATEAQRPQEGLLTP